MAGTNKLLTMVDAQRDFSAGELDIASKRRDDVPFLRTGARQAANWRLLNTGPIANRPGRRALWVQPQGRTELIEVLPGNSFYFQFTNALLTIRGGNQAVITTDPAPWTTGSVDQIMWAVAARDGDTR